MRTTSEIDLGAAARKAARTAATVVPGGVRFVRQIRSRSVAIVMYHGVIEESLAVPNWCQLSEHAFREQIEFLAHEYQVLPAPEVVKRLNDGLPLPERAACITFDDGFRSVARVACPILAEFAAPATVFLVTSLVGGDEPPWPEQLYRAFATTNQKEITFRSQRYSLVSHPERSLAFESICAALIRLPLEQKETEFDILLQNLGRSAEKNLPALAIMSWDEVEQLNSAGLITFGSHTHTHQILARCSTERQRTELSTSRAILHDRLGRADLVAYPNGSAGDFTESTKKLAAEAGYRAAMTTIRGMNTSRTDAYELRRIGVGANMSFSQFEIGMLGW